MTNGEKITLVIPEPINMIARARPLASLGEDKISETSAPPQVPTMHAKSNVR
jgi:hypothetical protein